MVKVMRLILGVSATMKTWMTLQRRTRRAKMMRTVMRTMEMRTKMWMKMDVPRGERSRTLTLSAVYAMLLRMVQTRSCPCVNGKHSEGSSCVSESHFMYLQRSVVCLSVWIAGLEQRCSFCSELNLNVQLVHLAFCLDKLANQTNLCFCLQQS